MLKVIFFWILGIIIILLIIIYLSSTYFISKSNNTKVPLFPEIEESSCINNDGCVLSTNHPDYPKGICVNKDWQEEWNRNPESVNYEVDCKAGPACTGPKFVAGGYRMPENDCRCVNNFCQAVDLSMYPGCWWSDC